MVSRDAFGGFTFAGFKPKNITVVSMVMINPSLRKSSMFFLQLKLLLSCIRIFIIRSKNYLFHTSKDINHTNDVDVSNASCCTVPISLRPKNIPIVVAATVVMSSPSPIDFSVIAAAMLDPSSIGFLMLS